MTMNELIYKRDSLIGPNIIAVGQSLKRLFGQLMSEHGMSDVPVMPLSTLLQEGDGIRQHELAARLGVDNTAVVRVLLQLEKQGLVKREEDSSDRRAKLLKLTDRGRELAKRIVKIRKEVRQEIFKDVPVEDMEATERLLKIVGKSISEFKIQS